MEYRVQPFFKWLGGKRKMLKQFHSYYPAALANGDVDTYIEPFVGGGAVLFDILQNYKVKNTVVIDANPMVIAAYLNVRDHAKGVLDAFEGIVGEYNSLPDLPKKEKYYYKLRQSYNENNCYDELKTAQFLFLLQTVYNGVYRVNQSDQFNTPFGKGRREVSVNRDNIRAASELLQNTDMITGDYTKCERLITDRTFIYFDPPYRPFGKSEYIRYTPKLFTDVQQIELADFYTKVSDMGAYAMLSNFYCGDGFFEELYKPYNIDILSATHAVNRQTDVKEILVTNYERGQK